MQAVGERASDEEWTADERRAKLDALRAVVPAGHLEQVRDLAPHIIPALAEDLVLAAHIAAMDLKTLQKVLTHAPGLIVQTPSKAPPKGAEWPVPPVAGRRAVRPDPWWRG